MKRNSLVPSSIVLCESWLERKVLHEDERSNKWKTRFASLIEVKPQSFEIRFYTKQSKHFSDITDDQVILLPWKHVAYMVDDDKERPHVVRITTFDDVASREERVVQLSLQFKEECLVWLKCIQRCALLSSGMRGHAFNVEVVANPDANRIAVSEERCVLHVGGDKAVLARKASHVVAGFWPLSSIRTYSTTDPSNFTFVGGRRSPLGEGTFLIRTNYGDADKLFNLFDFYTGAIRAPPEPTALFSAGAKFYPSTNQQIATRKLSQNAERSRNSNSFQPNPRWRKLSEPPPKPPRKHSLSARNSANFDQTHVTPTSDELSSSRPLADGATPNSDLTDFDRLLNAEEKSAISEEESAMADVVDFCRRIVVSIVEAASESGSSARPSNLYTSVSFKRS